MESDASHMQRVGFWVWGAKFSSHPETPPFGSLLHDVSGRQDSSLSITLGTVPLTTPLTIQPSFAPSVSLRRENSGGLNGNLEDVVLGGVVREYINNILDLHPDQDAIKTEKPVAGTGIMTNTILRSI